MSRRLLDLFAGCGGLSLGLSQAGWQPVAANEKDQWAADTYRRNHPAVDLIQSDIRDISSDELARRFHGRIDLVAGGPPCQGFSVSGKRQYGHVKEQNSLVEEFMRVVCAVRPTFVLLENVSGFKSGMMRQGHPVMDYVVRTLNSAGYDVRARMLQAIDFGVPSLRSRWFVIASQVALTQDPFPQPTHGLGRQPFVSVGEAISDLPELSAGQGIDGLVAYRTRARTSFQAEMREGSDGIYNHIAMKHTPRLVERFRNLVPGQKGFDIGRKGADGDVVTQYKSNNQRLVDTQPALCITANFQSTYVHPTQPRNLTAREAARLMTFPDSYVFCGKRTQMSSAFLKKYGREHEDHLSQYNQIGNSVPPRLARQIGESLARLANAGQSPHGRSEPVEVEGAAV